MSTPKILIIYTGGTIGMIKDQRTGELRSFNFEYIYDHVPELERFNFELKSISISKPIDSSEMTLCHWTDLVEIIEANYHNYDGFVILHGSDTMAFTASTLSFMIQGLTKPIILTGSQLPIGTIRTDGKENLITAVEIAGARDINGEAIVQEVAVYFEYSLYRGNRCSKVSANQFEAFQSPNYRELAIAGVNIEFAQDRLFRTKLTDLTIQK
jgi:L-asparaginase